MQNSTGYGPSRYGRLVFDGDPSSYETWEAKFLGHMRLQKLLKVIVAPDSEDVDEEKNAEAYAELIQFLDDRTLSLIMRDATDDGRKALKILRNHFRGSSTPRIISLYTELTSLVKRSDEAVTDYILRAETAASALRNAKEEVSDSLLVAMVLKGLPDSYQSFTTVITQSDKKQSFSDFKVALRSYEETENARSSYKDDSVLNMNLRKAGACKSEGCCFKCGEPGHFARECKRKPKGRWCFHCKMNNHDDKNCRNQNRGGRNTIAKASTESSDEENEHTFAFKMDFSEQQNVEVGKLLVDCGATSHIINDMSMFHKLDKSFKPDKHYIELANGERSNNVALKRGTAKMKFVDSRGKYVDIVLTNALYVPTFPQNIFSVQAATNKGASVSFQPDSAQLSLNGKEFNIEKHGKLYFLPIIDNNAHTMVNSVQELGLQGWHEVLGHCNFDDVIHLERVANGMRIQDKDIKPSECEVCLQGKMTNDRDRTPRIRSTKPLELVHTDLAGPISQVSCEGFRYAISFTDDYSGIIFVYFLKQKSDTTRAAEKFLADSAPYGIVNCIRSDNGTEFISQPFKELLRQNKIRHETSAPYSPHQNGTAERSWRTLFEMGRCLLIDAQLPKELWPYAVHTAAYINNRCFKKRLGQTPFFVLTGRKPDLSHMKVFGSKCYAYVEKKLKLDPRAKEGIFVGYDRCSPAYLVYFPTTGKVGKYRRVKFISKGKGMDISKQSEMVPELEEGSKDHEIGVRQKPTILEERAEANLEHEEVPCIDESRGRKYPGRERKTPAYLRDYDTDFEDDQAMINIDYCYYAAFPKSYREAMDSPDAAFWEEAMKEEMKSLVENETFTLEVLPEGKEAVGGRWVYTTKEGQGGSKTFKARFVAKGYSQSPGIDYKETFAPTANMTSMRVLMQLAAQYDLTLHQMDVKAAFLNAPIDCNVYMDQPEGFEVRHQDGQKLVYKLNKSLYGLKQSGRNWNLMLHKHLTENSFVQNHSDHCVYSKQSQSGIVVVVVWVDDFIIAGSSKNLLCAAKHMMTEKFKMKDLGRLSHFLGIDFDQGDGYVKMNQRKYIQKLLERHDMSDCKPRATPSEQKHDIGRGDPVDAHKYREVVGGLIYLMMCTRPDICWIVTKLSQYLSSPLTVHWVAVKHALRYLKGTIDFELCYKKSKNGLNLIGYSDADWASSEDDRRSTSGYCFSLTENGPLVSWKSRKQPTIALSTCEAEYIALAAAAQEILYLSQLLNEIGFQLKFHPVIYEDNQGTIALANNPVNRQRSKHIDIKYHFIRTEVNRGTLMLKYCPTEDMIADVMTKPANKAKLDKFKAFIFGI